MIKHIISGMVLAIFIPATVLATEKAIRIKTTDNIGGASQAAIVTGPGLVAEVGVAKQVGDCRLQDFLITSGLDAKPREDQEQVKPADELRENKAVLHFYGPGD